jgi:cytochrome oxidase Cu insertion factor (SCO1/SenC/PrrC family)
MAGMTPALRLFLCIAVAVSGSTASAQLFKCTRADGKVAYQDSPCDTGVTQKELKEIRSDVKDAAEGGITLTDVDSAARSFGDAKGAVSVLVIYSSQCPVCRQVMPELSALARDTQARGVQWKAFSVDAPEDRPGLPDYLAQTRAPFAAVAIRPWPSGNLTRAFAELGVTIADSFARPFIAVRDKAGKVVFQGDGVGQLSNVRAALDAALAS